MEQYKKYLASRLFTEDKMVTYRLVSRELKVHADMAKAMLYEFHHSQNSTSPGKVHATYLVSGSVKTGVQGDGDVDMTSSALESEVWGDEVFTQVLTLVAEDRLKDVLATYAKVTSLQVYSLSAHPLKELQLLTDVSQEIKGFAVEDYAEQSKTFGTIYNPSMRKRTRQSKRPASAAVPDPPAKKPTAAPATAPVTTKSAESVKTKGEPKAAPPKTAKQSSAEAAKKSAPPPSLKKSSSSGIMSAFSKAAAKASKPSSKASTPKTAETQSPALSDDGEDDNEVMPAPKAAPEGSGRQARRDREAELKRMMEEESEEEEEEPEKKEELEDEPMEDAPEPEAEEPATTKKDDGPSEVVSSTSNGRRRGKRRVMKKKQTMDDQGYFVTVQEQGWESFSEEDVPPPAAAKPKSSASSSGSQPGAKGKKAAPKGQGNIMSFFAKK